MGVNLSFDSTATEAELKAIRAYINARLGEEPKLATLTEAAPVAKAEPLTTKFQPEQNPADEPEKTTEAINDAPPAPAPAPARRKPGPKPKPTPAPEPVEEPEAVEAEDDVMGDAGGFSVDDAKSKARELVGEGKTADVRKALQAVGKNRVSEITTGAEATAFMKALG